MGRKLSVLDTNFVTNFSAYNQRQTVYNEPLIYHDVTMRSSETLTRANA
jgi:hypothetical protein